MSTFSTDMFGRPVIAPNNKRGIDGCSPTLKDEKLALPVEDIVMY